MHSSTLDSCCCCCYQVLECAPDVLLLCPCSRSAAAAVPDVQKLTQMPGFCSLPAVETGRVYVVDHGFFSRPGPRLIDGVELLAKLVYGVQEKPLNSCIAAAADQAVGIAICGGSHHQAEAHQQPQFLDGSLVVNVLVMSCQGDNGAITWLPYNV